VTTFGYPRRHCRLTSSTNDRARELAEAGAPAGTIVTAGEQSAGRGRSGRRWSAPPGTALLVSAILRPLDASHVLLPLAVPLAVCEAIEALAPVRCRVKWPNDVWICEPEADQGEGAAGSSGGGPEAKPVIPGRKVAGVLIEARPPDWALIGVGVNVAIPEGAFPRDLRWPATSVGHGVEVEAALAELCDRLETWVDAPAGDVLSAFAGRDALRGRRLRWEGAGGDAGSGAGVGAGIDERGNLVVERAAGERVALGAGEVQLALDR
jgi:BirA family transcriptional regulator, biotin operon repressor / biotin---[acetyl-CoA-carboxylase] ligase